MSDEVVESTNVSSESVESNFSEVDSWDDVGGSDVESNQVVDASADMDDVDASDKIDEPNKSNPIESLDSDEESEEEVSASEEQDVASKEEGSEEESLSKELSELPKSLQDKGITLQDGQVGKIVKIDGQDTFVSLEDLGNDYSGQKVLSKRFGELGNKEKILKQEIDEVNSYINKFAETLQKGDSVGAFTFFGKFAGIPPYLIKEQLIAALRPEFERRNQMSQVELENEVLVEQNNYLKEVNESESKRQVMEQANMELHNKINSIRETHNISEQEYVEAEELLKSELGEVTPESVASYVNEVRLYSKSEAYLKEAQIDVASNEKLLDTLKDILERNPDFTDEDVMSLLESSKKTVKKQAIASSLSKRIEKNEPKVTKAQSKKSEVAITPIDESLSWDDLF